MSKLEKDAFTIFTLFQNKANSGKSNLLTTSDNVVHINVGGNQLNGLNKRGRVSSFVEILY